MVFEGVDSSDRGGGEVSYLSDTQLIELCERHGLVEPFDRERVNPASIDLALGREFVNLSEQPVRYYADSIQHNGWHYASPEERFEACKVYLRPGVALLATTAERVAIPDRRVVLGRAIDNSLVEVPACTGELRLKSSAARAGLDHALAGWIDPGFDGTLTLELHAHRPIELVAGRCYVQLVVATMLAAPARGYQVTGRYVGESAMGAVLAKEGR